MDSTLIDFGLNSDLTGLAIHSWTIFIPLPLHVHASVYKTTNCHQFDVYLCALVEVFYLSVASSRCVKTQFKNKKQ